MAEESLLRTNNYMRIAISAAYEADRKGEIPIGAVIVSNGEVISAAHNLVISHNDPTAHAEVVAIREACIKLHTHMLGDCEMYVTLEPCAMCAKAILLARMKKLYFGAYNFKTGSIFHGENMVYLFENLLEVIGGVEETACSLILKRFFEARR